MLLSRRHLLSGLSASLIVAEPALAQHRWRPWPGRARAAVSLTYDDGLDSQLANAVPALDAAGFKATFFLTQENMAARLDDWTRVAAEGHEVADHTMTHPCELKGFRTSSFRDTQVQPMEAFLDEHFGADRVRTYAYPCGETGLGAGPVARRRARYLKALRGEVIAARTVEGAPNDPRRVLRDRFRLAGFEPTYEVDTPRLAFRYVRQAIGAGAWAILVFHEILPERRQDGDTRIAVHQQVLDWLKAAPVWCAPMGEVFQHASRADAALRRV